MRDNSRTACGDEWFGLHARHPHVLHAHGRTILLHDRQRVACTTHFVQCLCYQCCASLYDVCISHLSLQGAVLAGYVAGAARCFSCSDGDRDHSFVPSRDGTT